MVSSASDAFHVPDAAKLPNPPKNTDYVAIAEVLEDSTTIGYAMITVAQWTRRPQHVKSTRPMAEVILHRLGVAASVPDDGLIGDDDPAYEALGRGELLWSGRRYQLRWLDRDSTERAYSAYFA